MKKQLNTTLIYVLSIFGLLCCCFGGFDESLEKWQELMAEIEKNS